MENHSTNPSESVISNRKNVITGTQLTGALLTVISLAIVTLGDYLTGYNVAFEFFYLIPPGIAVWLLGNRPSLIVAGVTALIWTYTDFFAGQPFTSTWLPIWTVVERFAVLMVFVSILIHLWEEQAQQRKLIAELNDALENIRQLSGMLPVCAWCRKVRDDEGYWLQLESYITAHSDTQFTHGICPTCSTKMKEDLAKSQAAMKAGRL